jgi:hypothetical protein
MVHDRSWARRPCSSRSNEPADAATVSEGRMDVVATDETSAMERDREDMRAVE